jgi:hypothetical protein
VGTAHTSLVLFLADVPGPTRRSPTRRQLPHDRQMGDTGRVRTASINDAPTTEKVLQRVLHMHRWRFKVSPEAGLPPVTGEPIRDAAALATVPHPLIAWLARAGRFANVASATNTLGGGHA